MKRRTPEDGRSASTRSGSSRRSAVTIIELVMAIVILSIALPPMMASFADSSRQSIRPSNATVASFLAIDKMEEIVARRFRGADGYAQMDSIAGAESSITDFPLFSRTTLIENVSIDYVTGTLTTSVGETGYKRARVTVGWNGGAESMVIEHLFADFKL